MVTRHYLVQYRVVDGRKEEISRSLTGQDKFTVNPILTTSPSPTPASRVTSRRWGLASRSQPHAVDPARQIHVMSYDELVTSRLATIWIFDFLSSFGRNPDGLTGAEVGATPSSASTFAFESQWPVLGAVDGHVAAVNFQFRYRPGGGAIFASVKLIDAAAGGGFSRASPGSYVVANGKDAPSLWSEPEFTFGTTGWLPREVFCRLRGSRRAFVEFAEPSFASSSDERRREHLARIDFASAPGAAALFAEACSGPIGEAKR